LRNTCPLSDAICVLIHDRFALTGMLAASSLVCYNGAIFRDDFDGDEF
jgi:hypothetical protein